MTQSWCRPRLSLRATLLLAATACHELTLPTPNAAPTAASRVNAAPLAAPPRASAEASYPPESAQPTRLPPPPALQLDASKRRTLIDGMTRELIAHYVFLDVANQMRAALEAHVAAGDYDNVSDGPAFARIVTGHLRDVSRDSHLGLDFGPPSFASLPPTREERIELLRQRNFGFGAVDRFRGQIAHLVIRGFVPMSEPEVPHEIGRLMSSVADAAALIVDLRENLGGEPETVAFVASYLFDRAPVHLSDIYRRDDDSTQEFWTASELPGNRFGANKPVYLLTSKRTFSAGEDFAYSLQAIKRARVLGEQTHGGAHPCDAFPLEHGFFIVVPWGEAINPVTKANWEGVGVMPDIAMPADRVLDEALGLAARELATRKLTR